MPELETIENTANFTPSDGEVVTFYTEENGKIVIKVKKSDGTEQTLSGGGGYDHSDATDAAGCVWAYYNLSGSDETIWWQFSA